MLSVKQEVAERGFVTLPRFLNDVSSHDVIRQLGDPLQLGDGPPVHRLMPTHKAATTPNTYSGLYGLENFPYHTDMAHWRDPPRFLLLRCVVGFLEVPTLLVDSADIIRKTGASLLSRALVQPRRPIKGKMPILRLHHPREGFGIVRWDEVFIRPASRGGEIGVARFREELRSAPVTEIPLAESGDTLIVDNWRMLHARPAVPAHCAERILERAYLERLH